MSVQQPDWTVLLIGGPSGAGKSTAAEQIGRQWGISWLQIDDLRLALQASHVTLPARTEALYFFEETPNVWGLAPEQLRDALIAVGEVLAPAIEKVIDNHVATAAPVVLEGDGILPALLARPLVRTHAASGQLRAVFVVELDEAAILHNMLARGRGLAGRADIELHTEAHAKALYGHWLTAEVRHYGQPVLPPRPWDTLVARIMAACASGARKWRTPRTGRA